jgi:O-antigen/teichoic acid export membrane protein
MSWLSVVARALSVLAVLPLMLKRFDAATVAVWYLLASLIGLQQLADLGFAPTFVRVLAYARGEGAWSRLDRIWGSMHVVYGRLTAASVVLFGIAGTVALLRPIGALSTPSEGWMSWCVVVLMFVVNMQGNAYAAYLQGMDQIALVKRWEAITAAAAAACGIAVLAFGGGLLALVLMHQTWSGVAVLRNRWLCQHIDEGRVQGFTSRGLDAEVMETVWGSAIRSGVGVLLSRGVLLSSGLVYAQVADAAALAAYLLAFRVMQMLMDFANAPFYSKIPQMAAHYARGAIDSLGHTAERGMALAYWSFVVGVVGIGVGAPWGLTLIQSNVHWVPPLLWAMLGLAYFIERFGAMHIQLYSITNHIIWHKANGISGILYVILSLLLLPVYGVYAFPIAIAVGYAAFYSWYAPWHVYKAFSFDFWGMERRSALLPAAVLGAYGAIVVALRVHG